MEHNGAIDQIDGCPEIQATMITWGNHFRGLELTVEGILQQINIQLHLGNRWDPRCRFCFRASKASKASANWRDSRQKEARGKMGKWDETKKVSGNLWMLNTVILHGKWKWTCCFMCWKLHKFYQQRVQSSAGLLFGFFLFFTSCPATSIFLPGVGKKKQLLCWTSSIYPSHNCHSYIEIHRTRMNMLHDTNLLRLSFWNINLAPNHMQ